ncbi:MAG TPA: hypothetical protein VIN59_05535 [Alphaproteobacteria bacterium]
MASEIERKFLIVSNDWFALSKDQPRLLKQAYLPKNQKRHTRLFLEFDAAARGVHIILQNDRVRRVYPAQNITLNDVKQISEYNPETGEVLLEGPVEARVRRESGKPYGPDFYMRDVFAIKKYSEDFSQRVECEAVISHGMHAWQMYSGWCEFHVEKFRHTIPYEGHKWEVDQYLDKNQGLITADVEVKDASEFNTIAMLPGTGEDVTDVVELRNQYLGEHGAPMQYRRHSLSIGPVEPFTI